MQKSSDSIKNWTFLVKRPLLFCWWTLRYLCFNLTSYSLKKLLDRTFVFNENVFKGEFNIEDIMA